MGCPQRKLELGFYIFGPWSLLLLFFGLIKSNTIRLFCTFVSIKGTSTAPSPHQFIEPCSHHFICFPSPLSTTNSGHLPLSLSLSDTHTHTHRRTPKIVCMLLIHILQVIYHTFTEFVLILFSGNRI